MKTGQRIALLRGFMGVSQQELAHRISGRGEGHELVIELEQRGAGLGPMEIHSLSVAFGVDPSLMSAYLEERATAEEVRRGASVPPVVERNERGSWDAYFMRIATTVASRATCDRKHVGAVIERGRTILATGYNGSVAGLDHCDEVGHMMEDGHCVRTVHAENNAIIQAARNGMSIEGACIYVTASPCWQCFKMIANAGIKRIVFGEFYRDQRIFEAATKLHIELVGPTPEVSP